MNKQISLSEIEGTCANCKNLMVCMTDQFINTHVYTMNEKRCCAGFEKEKKLDQSRSNEPEKVEFT